jgi:hypothetical protein
MGMRRKIPQRVHDGQGRAPYCPDVEARPRFLDFRGNADVYETIRQGLEDCFHGQRARSSMECAAAVD